MLNKVVLIGRITKELELKYTPSGVAVLNFGLAVNRTFTNQQGEREADFPNVVTFRRQAENTANFCKKGSLVAIDGRIQTRTYDGQNGKVYVTEVVADSVQFLDSRGDNNQSNTNTSNSNKSPFNNQNKESSGYTRVDDDPFRNDGTPVDISDDDLPF